jgi:hypothetical protein
MEVSEEKDESFMNVCEIVLGGITLGTIAELFPREGCCISSV